MKVENAEDANEEIKGLFLGSAPERREEFERIWDKYSPQIIRIDDRPGFLVDGGPFGIIRFTHRTMLQLWILGFAAQQSYIQYSWPLVMSGCMGKCYPAAMNEVTDDREYCHLIEHVQNLNEIESLSEFQWPSNVPYPDGKPSAVLEQMTFDLLCMSAAYIFLHEVNHVRIKQENICTNNCHDEEYLCDQYARGILLDQIESYSVKSGYSLIWLKTKRAMSLGLASFWLLVLTPKTIWGGSQSHPSIMKRIKSFTDFLELPDNDHFWAYFASLVFSHLRYEKIVPDAFNFTTLKELCLTLVGYIEKETQFR